MKFTCIADTHARHSHLNLEDGEVLIHAGDVEARNKEMLVNFLGWFQKQPYQHKIFISGNHDGWIQQNPGEAKYIIDKYDVHYLQDEYITIDGMKIWGSPWSVNFGGWAFMKSDTELYEHYKQIPDDIDIVISHGPCYMMLDQTRSGEHAGSVGLTQLNPNYLICGHIHEEYGTLTKDDTTYINASVVDLQLNVKFKPITFTYGKER